MRGGGGGEPHPRNPTDTGLNLTAVNVGTYSGRVKWEVKVAPDSPPVFTLNSMASRQDVQTVYIASPGRLEVRVSGRDPVMRHIRDGITVTLAGLELPYVGDNLYAADVPKGNYQLQIEYTPVFNDPTWLRTLENVNGGATSLQTKITVNNVASGNVWVDFPYIEPI